jgi:hypothetical protein
MNFKFIAAITLVAAIPTAGYAQQDGPERGAPKETLSDVQKLVQSIAAYRGKSRPVANRSSGRSRNEATNI